MNQRHLWTFVALFLTVLGIPFVGRTQTTEGNALATETASTVDVVKVGEYQTPAGNLTSDAVITEIHPHIIGGRQAATLFIRNIPVLTFLSSSKVASHQTKVASNLTKAGNMRSVISSVDNEPVQRAGVIAAKINQLIQENVDASQITVSWKAGDKSTVANLSQNKGSSVQQLGDRYTIKINDQELVEINQDTRLADTTTNLAQDALQATNRLRRLIGQASPLSQVANLPMRAPFSIPKLPQQIAVGGVRLNFTGIASWYGYDGSSSQTASGERYYPEALTAAHRTLPLGTRVRVTNTRNGRSVVVRINDRGPYIRGRIIDVSAGAARVLGMMGSGIAPVQIDVLGR